MSQEKRSPTLRVREWLESRGAAAPDSRAIYGQVDRLAEQPYLVSQANEMARSGSTAGLRALLDGRILTSKGGTDSISMEGLGWSDLATRDRSQQWFVQQWYFVRYCYFEQATQGTLESVHRIVPVIRSWIETNLTIDALRQRDDLVWHDHVTALRCIHMIGYLKLLKRIGASVDEAFPRLYEFVNVHIRLLSSDEFYSKHTNHGFDQAVALYLLCNAFDLGELTREGSRVARERLIDEASFAFNEEGVHIENSPSYHPLMMGRLLQAKNILAAYEKAPVDFDFSGTFAKALDFLTYSLRPDGTLPAFGDTQLQQVASDFDSASSLPPNPHFQYAVTRGKQGERPPFNTRVFPKAGYAFIRSRWGDAAKFVEVIYLAVKCGFISTYHRHDDDNNVVLYAHGEDWLIESGVYKYHENDPFRVYLRSSLAHNIVSVEGAAVSRAIPRTERRCSFTAWQTKGATSTISVRTYMFEGFSYVRTVSLDRDTDEISIADQLTPLNGDFLRNFDQRFHFPADKEIEVVSDRRVNVRSGRTGRIMQIDVQEGEFDTVEVVSGRTDPPTGWTSPTIGTLQKASTLILSARQKADFRSRFSFTFPVHPRIQEQS